jgi:outer membrane receptor protein involved in Fe transport
MCKQLRILALLVGALAIARGAAGQETIHYASVSGRVTGPTGAAVDGAPVTARHTETNAAATTVTDREGRFRFAYLRVGPYELTVRQPGFKAASRALTLAAGAAVEVPVVLELGPAEATVTVSADAAVLETARSQVSETVSQSEIKPLPMNGRNFLDLALLVPGVSPTNVGGGTQIFAETSAVPGVGLSVGSQRNFSNNFIVDGLSANDDAAGLAGMTYGVDAVDQFQVVTSGGQAELGRALGGYMNVVTKSGTNTPRGDFYDYWRNSRFNAPNAISGQTLPMNQQQYGLSLGGPIVKNRTFYFANFEQRRLDQSGLVTIADANVPIINAKLAAVDYPGQAVTTGVYANPADTSNLLAKVDHQINGHDLLTIRYSFYDVRSSNARGAGGLNAPSASAGLDNVDHSLTAGNVLSLTPRLVLETRGQFASGDLRAPPTDPTGPAVTISGIATFGTLSASPTARTDTTFQLVSNLSYQTGAHAIRAGVDVLHNAATITFPRSIRGSYTFSSLANFLAGTYGSSGFTQTFGVTDVSLSNPNVGIYVQDEWRVASRLTLNAGVRYDLQWLETVQTDHNNLSPRAGFAWVPSASRRWLIRGNAGIFYDRVPLRAVANALLSAGNTTDLSQLAQTNISLSPTQTGAPVFPAILPAAVPVVTLVNFTTIDPHLQNAYSRQAGFEIERQIGARTTLSAGYEHLRGSHLLMQINQNVPTCVPAGTNNGCRPNSSYANNNQYSSAGSSVYDGLQVSFLQRLTAWFSCRASYTLSKSMNNVGEAFFNSPIDPTDINKDWGRSDDDQRHRLVISVAANTSTAPAKTVWEHLSHGFQLSALIQYYSALPFNITVAQGVNTIQGTPARPTVDGEFIPRNSGNGSPFSTVGVRLSRTFLSGRRVHLEGTAEAFNLFNRRNDVARVTTFGTGVYPANPAPTFGQITVVGDPRTWQFGLRASF